MRQLRARQIIAVSAESVPASRRVYRDAARLLFRSCSLQWRFRRSCSQPGDLDGCSPPAKSRSSIFACQRSFPARSRVRKARPNARTPQLRLSPGRGRCKRRSCSMTRWLFVGSSRRGGMWRSFSREVKGRSGSCRRGRISSGGSTFSPDISGSVPSLPSSGSPPAPGARRNVTPARPRRPNPRRTQPGREHRDTRNRKQP